MIKNYELEIKLSISAEEDINIEKAFYNSVKDYISSISFIEDMKNKGYTYDPSTKSWVSLNM